MSKNSSSSSSGIGFMGMLQVLFIGLKLGSVIDWSWWWVMAPTWIGTVIVLVAIVILVALYLTGKID